MLHHTKASTAKCCVTLNQVPPSASQVPHHIKSSAAKCRAIWVTCGVVWVKRNDIWRGVTLVTMQFAVFELCYAALDPCRSACRHSVGPVPCKMRQVSIQMPPHAAKQLSNAKLSNANCRAAWVQCYLLLNTGQMPPCAAQPGSAAA